MTNKIRTAIYCRVAREDDFAMELQERKLLRFAEQESFEVALVFKDNGATGRDFARAGYMQLRDAAQRGEVDVVIVSSLDRIARNHTQIVAQLDWFEKRNVTVISAVPGENNIKLFVPGIAQLVASIHAR